MSWLYHFLSLCSMLHSEKQTKQFAFLLAIHNPLWPPMLSSPEPSILVYKLNLSNCFAMACHGLPVFPWPLDYGWLGLLYWCVCVCSWRGCRTGGSWSCVSTHMEAKSQPEAPLSYCESRSLLGLSLVDTIPFWLASKAQGSGCLCLLGAGITSMSYALCLSCLFFTWILGIGPRSSV